MSETPCPRCHRATTDGLLCHSCCGKYHTARRAIIKHTPDLSATWMRQDRVARGTIHGRDRQLEAAEEGLEQAALHVLHRTRDARIALPATPLPVNLDAGDLYREAIAWLCTAAVDTPHLRELDPSEVDHARRLAARIEDTIDRREPDLYLGACDAPDTIHVDTTETDDGVVTFEVHTTDRICGVDLYARAGDTTVTCQACGYQYKIAERREQMLAEVANLLERPKVIADALTSLDLPITAKTLDDWIRRDRLLHEQGRPRRDGLPLILADPVYDDHGKPLYRVGSIIDRIEAIRARDDQTG